MTKTCGTCIHFVRYEGSVSFGKCALAKHTIAAYEKCGKFVCTPTADAVAVPDDGS